MHFEQAQKYKKVTTLPFTITMLSSKTLRVLINSNASVYAKPPWKALIVPKLSNIHASSVPCKQLSLSGKCMRRTGVPLRCLLQSLSYK